jgi:hypothetical protein
MSPRSRLGHRAKALRGSVGTILRRRTEIIGDQTLIGTTQLDDGRLKDLVANRLTASEAHHRVAQRRRECIRVVRCAGDNDMRIV